MIDSTIIDTVVAVADTVATIEPVLTDEVAEGGYTVASFIAEFWAELVLGVLAFVKIIVNLTPTENDNKVFGWLDSLINLIISDRKKS